MIRMLELVYCVEYDLGQGVRDKRKKKKSKKIYLLKVGVVI